jgi:hypothetical protein
VRVLKPSRKGDWHFIATLSHGGSSAEQDCAIGNKKMLAIGMSCCHCCRYLEGNRHLVRDLTDHHNLLRMMTTKSVTGWHRCWREMLSGNNLSIVYRVGRENHADTLSC